MDEEITHDEMTERYGPPEPLRVLEDGTKVLVENEDFLPIYLAAGDRFELYYERKAVVQGLFRKKTFVAKKTLATHY